MNLPKIIRLFYMVFTIYILLMVSITDIKFTHIFPGILFLWLLYFIYFFGYKHKMKRVRALPRLNKPWLLKQNKISLIIVGITTMIFSTLVVYYYTGQTPIDVIYNIRNDISTYYEYQFYFRENELNVFTFSKLPYIFMMFFVKLIFLYSWVAIFIIKGKPSRFDMFYLVLVTISPIYIGIGRGTNFEFFEFMVLLIYISFTKFKRSKSIFTVKPFIRSFIVGGAMVLLFLKGIENRGVESNYNITKDIIFESNSIIHQLAPSFTQILVKLFGYLGFGLFYISIFIRDVWFENINNFIAGLIPQGYVALSSETTIRIMKDLIDVGVRWEPDAVLFINNFGLIGLILFCFFIGVFSRYIKELSNKNGLVYLTEYIILLQIISLPVGKFVHTSSASLLIVALLTVSWLWRIFINVKIKL